MDGRTDGQMEDEQRVVGSDIQDPLPITERHSTMSTGQTPAPDLHRLVSRPYLLDDSVG